MTRKSLGYIELEWTCDHCETNNPGPRKFCTGCGAPQPDDVEFHQPVEAEFITDEAQLEKAKAGPDVHCPYCSARNPGNAKFCGACGGDLSRAEVRDSGDVIGAFRAEKGLQVECPACGTLNSAKSKECAGCGNRLPREKPPARKKEQAVRRGKIPAVGIIIVAAVCLAGVVGLIALLTRTEEQTAKVDSVSWTHTIPIEQLGPVEKEGWVDEIPSEAEILSCAEELRSTVSEPVADSIEVCGTPYTIDTGSGYGEVVQDCMYEVYDEFCSYTIMDWIEFDEVTASGQDLNIFWPDASLMDDQREGERESDYAVVFLAGNDRYTYHPDSGDEFQLYALGSEWTIKVNSFGSVVSVEK